MAESGQKQSFTGTMPNVRFLIGKRTIEPIAAAHKNLAEATSALRSESGRNWPALISCLLKPELEEPSQSGGTMILLMR